MRERKKMKIFAVSDVHGFCTELLAALDAAGFDRDNEEHLLVMCGDYFDRGSEPEAMLDFLEGLDRTRTVLLRGNHDDMMERALSEGKTGRIHEINGTEKTLSELFGLSPFYLSSALRESRFSPMGKRLHRLLGRMRDMFETERYCFVHGWLPSDGIGRFARLNAEPQYATAQEWRDARWAEWMEQYRNGKLLDGRQIVCGHRASAYASSFDPSRARDDSGIFYGDGVIAIDALTVVSGRVNVLVVEDEVMQSAVHEMSLMDEMLDEMRIGEKTVEMRLFDEKRQNIRCGDTIVFQDTKGRTLRTEVCGTYRYRSFARLAADFDPIMLGFDRTYSADGIAAFMKNIYGERERENGVLAIRVSLCRDSV